MRVGLDAAGHLNSDPEDLVHLAALILGEPV
jgi:hypothetical protein